MLYFIWLPWYQPISPHSTIVHQDLEDTSSLLIETTELTGFQKVKEWQNQHIHPSDIPELIARKIRESLKKTFKNISILCYCFEHAAVGRIIPLLINLEKTERAPLCLEGMGILLRFVVNCSRAIATETRWTSKFKGSSFKTTWHLSPKAFARRFTEAG